MIFPHGGRLKENLDYKLETYQFFLKHLAETKDQPLVLVGDFNIAHQEIDLARPRENKNNTHHLHLGGKKTDRQTGQPGLC